MSRSGYGDECEHWELYRASVERAIRGRRGQAFLRDLAAALDAMPEKVLIANELVSETGAVCAIGAVCKARGIDASKINYEEPWEVAQAIGVARSMAAEIAYENDEFGERNETPSKRWERMRKLVTENLRTAPPVT